MCGCKWYVCVMCVVGVMSQAITIQGNSLGGAGGSGETRGKGRGTWRDKGK